MLLAAVTLSSSGCCATGGGGARPPPVIEMVKLDITPCPAAHTADDALLLTIEQAAVPTQQG